MENLGPKQNDHQCLYDYDEESSTPAMTVFSCVYCGAPETEQEDAGTGA